MIPFAKTDDTETVYVSVFDNLIKFINREYLSLLREVIVEEEREPTLPDQVEHRLNAFQFSDFRKQVKGITSKVLEKLQKSNIFSSIESVFTAVDNRIQRNIIGQYQKAKFPFNKQTFTKDIPSLNDAIKENIELVQAIAQKQSLQLEMAVQQAVVQGSNFKIIEEEVMRQTDKGRAYARFVARDQVAKAYASINKDRQTSAGFPGYIWICMNDAQTRPRHRDHHGKYFRWDDPPEIRPGVHGHPGDDYQCRCKSRPAFGPEDESQSAPNIYPDNKGKRPVKKVFVDFDGNEFERTVWE